MKSLHPLVVGFACIFSLLGPSLTAAPEMATQLDLSSATTPAARKFYFETKPGQRYSLWRSTDLRTWQEVAGFPKVADGMSLEHTFAQQDKEFFQVEPIDEQAPTVVSQYPSVDGFAVGRFADLSIQLADATGINPASIRLTVGPSGQLAPGAAGLTISGNTITYDSGDAPLGAWGATISATLVAADTLGHTLTHTWSFRLEPEPLVAVNIFVFGSPTAQRAGQRVSGPAAALAARFPAPAGPVRANAPSPWVIESVLADRIVIAYEAGGSPSFAAGQLICNLAPVKESEIFYRRVVSTSDDVGNLKLTVMTDDVPLTEFISSGSAAISQNSVIFDLDESGTLTAARAVESPGTAFLPEIPFDLSGSSFKLLENGYQTTVAGVTLTSGGGETLVDVEAQELYWKFYPQFRAGIEFGNNPFPLSKWVESADAVFTGRASCSVVLRATGRLAGSFSERPIINVPIGKVSFIGSIGTVPIYTSVKFDFAVKTKASVQALIVSEMTYRQGFQASFGLEYRKATGLDWVNSFQVDKPELGGNAALTGEFSLEVTIEPKATALVYGTAGFQASLEPSGKITTRASTTTTPPFVALDGEIEASLDFVIQPAGLFFDAIYPVNKPMLSFPIWKNEWPLTAQTLAFKTQPLSRTVAPGENVSFTCSVESPSFLTFQWYQNGRLLPRQTSRSLFLDRVTSGFAGNYFVRVLAGNQSIDSKIATLTVQSVTPETLDTDRDGIPDIYETNTGVWVSIANRGTDPFDWDSDDDGLSDEVETNTGIYVSRSNTGTNPSKFDTDGDGINDKREIDLGTNPNAAPVPAGFAYVAAGSLPSSSELGAQSVGSFYMARTETTRSQFQSVQSWAAVNGYDIGNMGRGMLNGNFTAGSTGWSEIGPIIFSYPASGGNPGGYGVMDATAGGWGIWVGNTINTISLASMGLVAGNTYTFSQDMRIEGAEGSNIGGIKIDFVPAGTTTDLRIPKIGTGSTWETYSYSISIPAGTVGIKVVLLWGNASKVGFDNFRVENGFVPPPVRNGDNEPVTNFSWNQVVKWCNARSEQEGLMPVYKLGSSVYRTGYGTPTVNTAANGYRLPSEKEWEFAARGGANTNGYEYSGSNSVNAVAWYTSNSGNIPQAVATKQANELGLLDMSGNVWEWCNDFVGLYPVFRGGCWESSASDCRVGSRGAFESEGSNVIGFRLARSSVP